MLRLPPRSALRVVFVFAVGFTLACSTGVNPATGRREVVLMTPEDEQRVDEEATRELAASVGLVGDPALSSYVAGVGSALAEYSPRQDLEYSFQIVEMDEPNAFALPGGHIYISRGLLVLANTEAELAHVLGHEIGHVAARHAASRDAHMKTFGLATLLGDLLSGGGEKLPDSESLGGDPIARYARNQERQADSIGQEIAARAGVEPSGMARFLTSLDNYTKLTQGFSMPQTYFATHPATRERMAEAATRAQSETWKGSDATPGGSFPPYDDARNDYLDHVEGMTVTRPASEGVFVEERLIHADLGFSVRFPHGWTTRNEAARVMAIAPRRDALLLLELQGTGSDPIAAAREYAEEAGFALHRATPVRIGELPGFRALTVVPTAQGPMNAEITWIAYEGRVYRLSGGMRAGQLRKYEGLFRKFAQSFRPLSPEDAASVEELRLRSARALPGETLAELSARTGNQWDLTFTSVVNGIFAHDTLQSDQRIKIAVKEPYVASPPPPEAKNAEVGAREAAPAP